MNHTSIVSKQQLKFQNERIIQQFSLCLCFLRWLSCSTYDVKNAQKNSSNAQVSTTQHRALLSTGDVKHAQPKLPRTRQASHVIEHYSALAMSSATNMHTSRTTQHRALLNTGDVKHVRSITENCHARSKHHTALSIAQHWRCQTRTSSTSTLHWPKANKQNR